MTKIYGLTGGLGAGKSLVASYLASFGVPIFDADEVSRQLCQVGHQGYQLLLETFGTDILDHSAVQDGHHPIDRMKLAKIVFEDPIKKAKIESILHPLIRQALEKNYQIWNHSKVPFIIYNAALLIETGYYKQLDGIILVDAPIELRLQRAIQRGMAQEDAYKRIAWQIPHEIHKKIARWTIDNSLSKEYTKEQTQRLYTQLMSISAP